jgi:large subunit ribosomal protein L17
MRHQKAGKKFNRDSKSRKALFRSLAYGLIREGRVVTTESKAKTLRSLADRLVTTARGADELHARRQIQAYFGKRDAANTLIDRILPLHTDRQSGFTTIQSVGVRAGDNSEMYEVRWMVMPETNGNLKNPTPAPKNEKKAAAPKAAAKKTTKTTRKAKTA